MMLKLVVQIKYLAEIDRINWQVHPKVNEG